MGEGCRPLPPRRNPKSQGGVAFETSEDGVEGWPGAPRLLVWEHLTGGYASGLQTQADQLWAPALPLTPSVTLGQAQNLPEPQFPHLEHGVRVPTPQAI